MSLIFELTDDDDDNNDGDGEDVNDDDNDDKSGVYQRERERPMKTFLCHNFFLTDSFQRYHDCQQSISISSKLEDHDDADDDNDFLLQSYDTIQLDCQRY